jgi:PAS domain S-box-containing protein
VKKTATTPVKFFVLIAVLTAGYFVLGKAGLAFASINPSASAIWPATGFALASLLIFGTRIWSAIFIGAFLVNITTSEVWSAAVGIAIGNTLEALAACYLVSRFAGGKKAFERPKHVVLFAFLAGDVATVISATVGATVLILTGLADSSQFIPIWTTWWLGDMGGAIIFTPLLLTWYALPRVSIKPIKAAEFILLLLFLVAINYMLFTRRFPHAYLFILPLIWSAFRFKLRETATVLGLIMMLITHATIHGTGPFVMSGFSINQALLQLQIFMVIVGVTGLTIASAIEESRRTDQKLFARERRFQALIEKNTDAVVLIDPGAAITYASPSTETVLGFTPEEVVGRNGFSFIHPEDLAQAKKDLTSVILRPNDSIIGNYRMKRKDGVWVWIETIGRNLLFDPAVQAVVVNFRDITDKKQLEDAKDEFLMTAAHQLRSPLTAIRWNLESLIGEKTKLAPKIKEQLSAIATSNQKMITTVNELLDIARIIQGKLPTSVETVDIVRTVRKVIKEQEEFANRRHITLKFTVHPKTVPALLDPKHFRDAVGNMIGNAIKYSYDGDTVTIAIEKNDTHTVVRVSDTGIGIPKAEQHKLFTKFYRASNARNRDAQGTGLGLFIIKSYTEGWGGSVTITSPTSGDRGTEIAVTIPARKGGI